MTERRCAIYTRKSTEEGLDQAFNSLDAQREACDAYILSQSGEGWRGSARRYDDGGFSGGTMERPGLKALLADIRAGKIDVVVVYKVDRLTRSLGDFARIVETFDQSGVSFVSVTQAFNTTTSMGRLTLNVLLSFAQFEREVTGERIRDKIAASKRKGMWMGGLLPLGYDAPVDLQTRALVVNPIESEQVRQIYKTYLEVGSVHRLVERLDETEIRSKVVVGENGKRRGGGPLGRGALLHLLRNRTYLGEIPHGQTSYPGAHPAIIDRTLFDAVQAKLAGNRTDRKIKRARTAPLVGRLFDQDGERMSPTHATAKSGRKYRYYVSLSCTRGVAREADDGLRRISATALEAFLGERLGVASGCHLDLQDICSDGLLRRVDILAAHIVVTLHGTLLPGWNADPTAAVAQLQASVAADRVWVDEKDPALVKWSIGVRARFVGGRTQFTGAPRVRARKDRALIGALKSAHEKMDRIVAGDAPPIRTQYERNLIGLACLAPDIQQAILEGRQPQSLTLQDLILGGIDPCWRAQRRALGFQPSL